MYSYFCTMRNMLLVIVLFQIGLSHLTISISETVSFENYVNIFSSCITVLKFSDNTSLQNSVNLTSSKNPVVLSTMKHYQFLRIDNFTVELQPFVLNQI